MTFSSALLRSSSSPCVPTLRASLRSSSIAPNMGSSGAEPGLGAIGGAVALRLSEFVRDDEREVEEGKRVSMGGWTWGLYMWLCR